MKTLLIESVSNGWIVRPFTSNPGWACGMDAPVVAVYTRISDLQADLPRLLDSFVPSQSPISPSS